MIPLLLTSRKGHFFRMNTQPNPFLSPPRLPAHPHISNRIAAVLDRLAACQEKPYLREQFRLAVCQELGIKNQYTMILNNKVQPTLYQASVFALLLNVTVDELITLGA